MTDAETPPLALKYRPTTFPDLIGQRINAVVLQRMVDTGQVPSALLFSGPSGVGKTTASRVLASQLGASDVIEVDSASNGGVDQIRKLLEVARYSTGGAHRVLVLDEAHSITRQGFEALLKALEEPPGNTIFILVTTEPHKIPGTVLSRLVEFRFKAVSDADVLDRLAVVAQKESIPADFELLNYLVRKAAGNVRTALTSLDQCWRAGVTSREDYLELTGEHDPAPALLEACSTGDHAKVFSVLDRQLSSVGSPGQIVTELISCIRDLLVLRSGGELKATGEDYEIRRGLALKLEQERLLAGIRVLWEVRTKLRVDDPRGSLEMALVLITEVFTRGKDIAPKKILNQPPVVANGHDTLKTSSVTVVGLPPAAKEELAGKRMTFADLQRFASGNNATIHDGPPK